MIRSRLGLLVLLGLCASVLWMACGDDDDGNGTGPNGDTTFDEVIADTSVSAPDMTDPNDSVWDSVTATTIEVKTSNPLPTSAKVAIVTGSVDVQAIVTADKLYLRLQWDDTDHDILRDYWELKRLQDTTGGHVFEFTRHIEAHEDMVLVMFEGGYNGWDTWCWRALTTGYMNLAEDMTYRTALDSLVADAGGQVTGYKNEQYGDATRPKWVHKDMGDFEDSVLLVQDTVFASNTQYDPSWEVGDIVPGWAMDTSVIGWLQEQPQSPWDIQAVYEHDGGNDLYTLVMARDLAAGVEDVDMTTKDTLVARIGVFENQVDLHTLGSGRGFTQDFYILLP